MQVTSSIQIPKRVDPKRKQLIKQLQNDIKNIKKQNISTPKRNPSQDNDDYQNMDTLKKKQHMDQLAIRYGKQNHRTQKQNDRLFPHNKPYEIPIRPPMNPQTNFEYMNGPQAQIDRTVRKEDSYTLPNIPVLYPMMLDKRIPNLKDPNLNIFTDKQRLLMTIQQKLDSYLLFVKQNRKKKKGQFFSTIKKSFLQNQRIFLEFSHLKKILFVDSNLYKVQKFGEGVSVDCLIDINLNSNESDSTSLEQELNQRKNTFPHKLFALKEELKNTKGQQKVQIPEVEFEFQKHIETSKIIMKESLKNRLDGEMMNKKKLNKFFVLNKDSQEYHMSKNILMTGMKRVEIIIQKEAQIDLKLFEKKMRQQKQLNQKQIQSIIDEIHFVYRNKGVTNLLFDQLIEALSKKLILSLDLIKKCIQIFIETGPKINKQKPFLRSINHKNGRIIQFEKSCIDEFKAMIIKRQEFMNRFKFDLEMSTEQVRKKFEAERDKVFEEVKGITFDEVVQRNPVLKPSLSQTTQNVNVDFSQVRPFVEKPKKYKIDGNSSQSEHQDNEDEEIGIPSQLYLQTQSIIKEEKDNARKARKAYDQVRKRKLQELLKERPKTQEEKEVSRNQLDEQFKSTLSGSDEVVQKTQFK